MPSRTYIAMTTTGNDTWKESICPPVSWNGGVGGQGPYAGRCGWRTSPPSGHGSNIRSEGRGLAERQYLRVRDGAPVIPIQNVAHCKRGVQHSWHWRVGSNAELVRRSEGGGPIGRVFFFYFSGSEGMVYRNRNRILQGRSCCPTLKKRAPTVARGRKSKRAPCNRQLVRDPM